MAEAARIEITSREAMFAIAFVFTIVVTVGLIQAGVITNPLTLGLVVTITIVMIFVGTLLAQRGIISRGALPLWYVLIFGVVLLFYGGIEAGYIPVAFIISKATVMEIALTNSLFYALVFTAIVAAVAAAYAGYKYYKKRALAMV